MAITKTTETTKPDNAATPQDTPQIFINEEFGSVRTLQLNNDAYFVGKDIAIALKYSNPQKAIRDHVEDCDKIMGEPKVTPSIKDSLGRDQYPTWINESGAYALILGSKLKSARKFKHWITSEVIPTILKTGGYVHNADTFLNTYLPNADEPTKLMFKTQLSVIKNLNDTIERNKPLVAFATQVTHSKDTIDIEEMAKIAQSEHINIGRNRLFKWLKDNKILRSNNTPYQKYLEQGYFTVIETTKPTSKGTLLFPKTLITGKGQLWLINKLKAEYTTYAV